MSAPRSERLELRLTPAQKELIGKGASFQGKSVSAYALEVLVTAAQRDASDREGAPGALGWMRGTASIVGDITGPTDADGWEPVDLPR